MTTLFDVLQKPEGEFSLTEAALALAHETPLVLNNDFDIQQYSDKINQMAEELKPRIAGKQPEDIISEMNKYLFEEHGLKYGKSDFLNNILDSKKGNCVGLSSLYLALAEKLKLPIYGVAFPKHVIVRWDDGKFKRNIETTKHGVEFSDEEYIADSHTIDILEDIYARNLSKKEIIEFVLDNRETLAQQKVMFKNPDSSENAMEEQKQKIRFWVEGKGWVKDLDLEKKLCNTNESYVAEDSNSHFYFVVENKIPIISKIFPAVYSVFVKADKPVEAAYEPLSAKKIAKKYQKCQNPLKSKDTGA